MAFIPKKEALLVGRLANGFLWSRQQGELSGVGFLKLLDLRFCASIRSYSSSSKRSLKIRIPEKVNGEHKETVEDIEAKFGDHEEPEEIKEVLNKTSRIEPSDFGFAIDYLSPVKEHSRPKRRSEYTSEEGFHMNFLDLPTNRRVGFHTRLKLGDYGSRRRKWVHKRGFFGPPYTLDDGVDQIALTDFRDNRSEKAPSYRIFDQARLHEERMSKPQPWSPLGHIPMGRVTERDNYFELDGKAKLGNKILEVEIPVEDLRVDTRYSVLKKMKEEGTATEDTIRILEQRIEADDELRKFCWIDYDPMMLMTVGAQGSGKSKFSLNLVEHGALPWVRINQDTIRDGMRGTKEDCVEKARHMLKQGFCVVIDRMNFSPSQSSNSIDDE